MKNHAFVKVRDASRRPVRSLYRRDGSFYARLNWDGVRGWYPLEKAHDVETAKQEKAALEAIRERGEKPPGKEEASASMNFSDFTKEYLRLIQHVKKPRTFEGEEDQINGALAPFFGKMNLAEITQRHVEEFRAKRLKDKKAARTVNHNIIVLRNVLKKAIGFGRIKSDPTRDITPLKVPKGHKQFLPMETIRGAADWIRGNVREGDVIANAVLFLAFTGARRTEGLAVRWQDVDFPGERVWIGASGDTKNHNARHVDFHPDLKELLSAMRTNGGKDEFLFPSYRTPDDAGFGHLKDIREAVALARTAKKHAYWSPHDLRHHFASRCIMAGIDFKQTALWLGHRDGGVLVATVYGHLAESHGKAQALKLLATKLLSSEERMIPLNGQDHAKLAGDVLESGAALNHRVQV